MFQNDTLNQQFVLWNTSDKNLETQFGGRFVYFAPGEKKSFGDREDVLNHVFFQLEKYGVTKLKIDATPEESKKALLSGLKERHKMLRFVIEQFQAMNKAREAQKMAPEVPSEYVSDCVIEDQIILDKIKDIDGDKQKKVSEYFKNLEIKEKEIISELDNDPKLNVSSTGASIEKKLGRPRKEKVNNDLSSSQVA